MSLKDQQRLAGIIESGGYGQDDFYGRRGMDDPHGRRSEVEGERQQELARINGEIDIIAGARDAAMNVVGAAEKLVKEMDALDQSIEEAGRLLSGSLKKKLENESEKLGRMMSDLQHYAKNRIDALLKDAEDSARAELKDYGG